MIEQETIRFERQDSDVFVYGYPELKDRKGILAGDGMAFSLAKAGGIMNCI